MTTTAAAAYATCVNCLALVTSTDGRAWTHMRHRCPGCHTTATSTADSCVCATDTFFQAMIDKCPDAEPQLCDFGPCARPVDPSHTCTDHPDSCGFCCE